jgi:hypothetical protein
MNKKLNVIAIALVLITGLWLGLALHRTQLTQSVQAQQTKTNQATVQKWEYCTVFPVNKIHRNDSKITGTAVISYMRGSGYQSEKVEATIEGGVNSLNLATHNALAKAISKLGDEGWEMVGEGTLLSESSSNQKVLYFKRSKQ